MKIRSCESIERIVAKVVGPFLYNLNQRNQQIFMFWKNQKSMSGVLADWYKYQLVLFNMIQNAYKYNLEGGYIFIMLSLKKIPQSHEEEENIISSDAKEPAFNYFLHTEIIDTGCGIS